MKTRNVQAMVKKKTPKLQSTWIWIFISPRLECPSTGPDKWARIHANLSDDDKKKT